MPARTIPLLDVTATSCLLRFWSDLYPQRIFSHTMRIFSHSVRILCVWRGGVSVSHGMRIQFFVFPFEFLEMDLKK